MGKSNLSILTDTIVVVTQPKSTGNYLKIMTMTHIQREKNVLFTQDYSVYHLFLKKQTRFVKWFINLKHAGSIVQEQALYKV